MSRNLIHLLLVGSEGCKFENEFSSPLASVAPSSSLPILKKKKKLPIVTMCSKCVQVKHVQRLAETTAADHSSPNMT